MKCRRADIELRRPRVAVTEFRVRTKRMPHCLHRRGRNAHATIDQRRIAVRILKMSGRNTRYSAESCKRTDHRNKVCHSRSAMPTASEPIHWALHSIGDAIVRRTPLLVIAASQGRISGGISGLCRRISCSSAINLPKEQLQRESRSSGGRILTKCADSTGAP
jgi:hypothetical protein